MLLPDFLEEKGMPYCPHTMLQPGLVFYWLLFARGILLSVSRHVTSKFTVEIQDRGFYLNYVLLLWHSTKMVSDS